MTDERVYGRADALIEGRQYDQARELLRGVLAEDPADGAALLLLARTDSEAGDVAAARAHAQQAANIPQWRPEAAMLLARLVSADPQSPDAESVSWAAEAVRLAPDEWRYRSMLAACLSDAGHHDDAIAQAQIAVQMAPQDPDTRAWALTALGRTLAASPAHRRQGAEVMREASALEPTDPAIAQSLAIAQFSAGKRADAIATALRVLRVTPTERSLPLLSATALFLLVRRALGWLLIVAWTVPMVFIGALGTLLGPVATARIGGAVGLVLVATVAVLDLAPLRDASVRRAVWRVARRRPVVWIVLILVAVSMLCYTAALAFGWFVGVALPALVITSARIIHAYSAFGLRAPED